MYSWPTRTRQSVRRARAPRTAPGIAPAIARAAGISGPSIGVPGQPLVYTLSASESGLSADTVYSYSVQWGDGSPTQNFSGLSGTQASHAYTTLGSYSISVTATDPNGDAITYSATVQGTVVLNF